MVSHVGARGLLGGVAMVLASLCFAVYCDAVRSEPIDEARRAHQVCSRIVEPPQSTPFDETEIQCYYAGAGCAQWSGTEVADQLDERCAIRVYLRSGKVAVLRRLYLDAEAEGYVFDEHCFRPDGSLVSLRREVGTGSGSREETTIWFDGHGQELDRESRTTETAAGASQSVNQQEMPPLPPYFWAMQILAEISRLDEASHVSASDDPTGLSSVAAKRTVEEIADEVLRYVKRRNFHALADLVHPDFGLVLVARGADGAERDMVFSRADVRGLNHRLFIEDDVASGDGPEIVVEQDFDFYYRHFIYDRDYAFAPQVSYNCGLAQGAAIAVPADGHGGAIVVERRFPGPVTHAEQTAATSLQLVFEPHQGRWYLTALVHHLEALR